MSEGTPESWTMQTIGLIRSPFPEKFGVPRQPGLHQLQSRIELHPHLIMPMPFAGWNNSATSGSPLYFT